MKKYLFFLMVLILAVSLSFFGISCRETVAPAEAEAEEEAVEEEAVEEEAVEEEEVEEEAAEEEAALDLSGMTLSFTIMPWIKTPAFDSLVADFESETGVKFDFLVNEDHIAILTKWTAGDRTDLLGYFCNASWVLKLRPETELVDLSSEKFIETSAQGKFGGSAWGKTYGALPMPPTVYAVLYNKELFEQAGINMPEDTPVGHEGFVALVDKIKSAGITPMVEAGGSPWQLTSYPSVHMWAEALVNTDVADMINKNESDFSDPRLLQGWIKYKELLDAGYFNDDFLTADYTAQMTQIFEGEAAMTVGGHTGMLGTMEATYGVDEVDEKIGYFFISETANLISFNVAAGIYVPKTGDAEKEAAALEFIRYMTGPRYQKYADESNFYPAFSGFKVSDPDSLSENYKGIMAAYEEGPVAPAFNVVVIPDTGLSYDFLYEMVAGQITPEEVAEAYSEVGIQSGIDMGLDGF